MSIILRILRQIQAAATTAIGLIMIWQAVSIYWAGNSPDNFSAAGVRIAPVYTRELVEGRFLSFLPLFFMYISLTVVGLVLQAAEGEYRARLIAAIPPEDRLRRLRRRIKAIPAFIQANVQIEQNRRRGTWISAGVIIFVCAFMSGKYLLNAENFASLDLEPVMGSMVKHVVPWVAVGLAAGIAASLINGQSAQRELELIKLLPQEEPEPAAPDEKKRLTPALRIALYLAAIILIALGVANGGMWDVLVKAVNICTECIGLG